MFDNQRNGIRVASAHRESGLWQLEAPINPELTVEMVVQFPYQQAVHPYTSDQVAADIRLYCLQKMIEQAAQRAQEELTDRYNNGELA